MDWFQKLSFRSKLFEKEEHASGEKHRPSLPNFSPFIRKMKNKIKTISNAVTLSTEDKRDEEYSNEDIIQPHTKIHENRMFAFLHQKRNKKTLKTSNIKSIDHMFTDDEVFPPHTKYEIPTDINNNNIRNTSSIDLLLFVDTQEISLTLNHTNISQTISHAIIDEKINGILQTNTNTNTTIDEKTDNELILVQKPSAITADLTQLLSGIRSTVSQKFNTLYENARDSWNMNIVNPNLPLSSASIALPLNFHQQWPYNQRDNRELSVKVVQARYILINWYRKSNTPMIDAIHLHILCFIGHHQCYLDEYTVIKLIGKGTFAHVFQCQNIVSGKIDALKVYSKRILIDTHQIGHINDERILFDLIHHENQSRHKQMACHRRNYDRNANENTNVSQKCRDVDILLKDFVNPFVITVKYAFQDECSLYYIFDYLCGGEIYFHLKEHIRFTLSEAKFIAAQVALAIGFLHEFNFIWRSCKPEDILLDERGYVKITDFGCGKLLSNANDTKDNSMMKSHTFCWSIPEYAPPEMLASHTNTHGLEADWWSFGCFLFELVTGSSPFSTFNCRTNDEIYISIVNVVLQFPIAMDIGIGSESIGEYVEFEDICRQLLQKKPMKRLGFGDGDVNEVVGHAFFNEIDFIRLLKKEIEPVFNPKRIRDIYDYCNIDEEFVLDVERVERFESRKLYPKIKLNDDPWLNCDLKYF